MRHLTRGVVIATLAFAGALAALVSSGQAMLGGTMGDEPTITVQRDGNTLLSYEVEGLMATKGMVQAQVSDRFVLEVSAMITDGTSVVGTIDPVQLLLLPDKDTSMKQGSQVPLTGIVQLLAEPRPDPTRITDLLNRGESLTLTASVVLVLDDGSGARHTLDTIEVTTIVSPRDS